MSTLQIEVREKPTELVQCRLTPSEKQALRQAAIARNMNMTDLMRSVIQQLAA